MLSVRLLVNSRLLVVKFWDSDKLYAGFQLWGERGSTPPIPTLFKGSNVLHMLASLLIASISLFQDDCLRSLTRFAAAHWTVASLSVVQRHFCKLFACEY